MRGILLPVPSPTKETHGIEYSSGVHSVRVIRIFSKLLFEILVLCQYKCDIWTTFDRLKKTKLFHFKIIQIIDCAF